MKIPNEVLTVAYEKQLQGYSDSLIAKELPIGKTALAKLRNGKYDRFPAIDTSTLSKKIVSVSRNNSRRISKEKLEKAYALIKQGCFDDEIITQTGICGSTLKKLSNGKYPGFSAIERASVRRYKEKLISTETLDETHKLLLNQQHSVTEVAELVGISHTTVRKLREGKRDGFMAVERSSKPRKNDFPKETLQQAYEFLQAGCSDKEAAKKSGMSYTSVGKLRKGGYPGFSEIIRVEKVKKKARARIKAELLQQAYNLLLQNQCNEAISRQVGIHSSSVKKLREGGFEGFPPITSQETDQSQPLSSIINKKREHTKMYSLKNMGRVEIFESEFLERLRKLSDILLSMNAFSSSLLNEYSKRYGIATSTSWKLLKEGFGIYSLLLPDSRGKGEGSVKTVKQLERAVESLYSETYLRLLAGQSKEGIYQDLEERFQKASLSLQEAMEDLFAGQIVGFVSVPRVLSCCIPSRNMVLNIFSLVMKGIDKREICRKIQIPGWKLIRIIHGRYSSEDLID